MAFLRLLFRHRTGNRPDLEALRAVAQLVFTQNDIDLQVTIGAATTLDAGMTKIDVGDCTVLLGDQQKLFDTVTPRPAPGSAVVFVVGEIARQPAASGCAKHPDDCPGVVITQSAAQGVDAAGGRWVLAHELGHLLGLPHVNDTSRLMNDPATAITAAVPVLTDDERAIIAGSAPLAAAAFALAEEARTVLVAPPPSRKRRTRKKQARKGAKKRVKARAPRPRGGKKARRRGGKSK